MNYEFKNKDIEAIVNHFKITLFDVVAKNQSIMNDIEIAIVNENDPAREEQLRDLWAQYHEAVKISLSSADSLIVAIQGLDACERAYNEFVQATVSNNALTEGAIQNVTPMEEEKKVEDAATAVEEPAPEEVVENSTNFSEEPTGVASNTEEITEETTISEEPVENVSASDTDVETTSEEAEESKDEVVEEAVTEAISDAVVVEEDSASEPVSEDENSRDEKDENVEEEASKEEIVSSEETSVVPEVSLPTEETTEVKETETKLGEETTSAVVLPTITPEGEKPAPVETAAIEAQPTSGVELPKVEVPVEDVSKVSTTDEAVPASLPVIEDGPKEVEPVALPTIPTLESLSAEPTESSNVISPEKMTFIKSTTNEDRAILVNQNQVGKLRSSKDTQVALLNSRAGSSPIQENTTIEQQIQEMLNEQKLLYDRGDIEGAEKIGEDISVLTKKAIPPAA